MYTQFLQPKSFELGLVQGDECDFAARQETLCRYLSYILFIPFDVVIR